LERLSSGYYRTFCTTLEQIQIPTPIGFTLDVLIREFKLKNISFQLGTPMSQIMQRMQANGVEPLLGSNNQEKNGLSNKAFLMTMETNVGAMDRLLLLVKEMGDLNVI